MSVRRHVPSARVAALILIALAAGARRVDAQPPGQQGLFAAVSSDNAGQAQMQTQAVDRSIRRSRRVSIDVAQITAPAATNRRDRAAASLVLNLFSDVTYSAVLDRIDGGARGFVWVGHVPGVDGSSVSLSVHDGVMAGNVVTPDGTYSIRYAGGRVHTIAEVDPSVHPAEIDPIPVTAARQDAIAARTADQPIAAADDGSTIDVMVLYTPAVVAARGGENAVQALANLGISETNTSYANSGIAQRVRLAFAGLVSYTEAGNMSTDLSNVRSGSAAGLSGVASLRDNNAADIVSLWVHYNPLPACGVGYLMSSVSTSFAPFAFDVVADDCVSPNYTFAHEMGHNMGALHDWYVDSGTAPYTYAHGFVNPSSRWRTIMAYNDQCAAQGFNCARLLYWANPTRSAPSPYPATPMGVAGGTNTSCVTGNIANPLCDADDSRTLNNTAFSVANFRQARPVALTVTSLTPNTASPAAPGTPVTWTAAVSGGTGPFTYKFYVYNGASWTLAQDWSLANSWTWTPGTPGNYTIQVWVRNSGSTADYDAYGSAAFSVSNPALRVTALAPSVSSPVAVNTSVTWSASATGGTGPYTFKFYVYNGTSWSLGRDWASGSTWVWTPSAPGSYIVQVWARNAGSSADYDAWLGSSSFTVTGPPPLAVSALTPSPAGSTSLGTSVTWTALATGGTAPYSYKFYLYNGTSWLLARDWGSAATWTWTPSATGSYIVQVWVRNTGSSASYDAWLGSSSYAITPAAPLDVTALSPSMTTAAVGTPVLWTTTAAAGTSPYTYKFYVFDGTTWTIGQDWSSANTWQWTPPAAGTYTIQVWARNAGSSASLDAWRGYSGYVVTASDPPQR